MREYATKQGFQIIREFVDVETAKIAGRKAFGEMVGFLKRHRECRIFELATSAVTVRRQKNPSAYKEFRLTQRNSQKHSEHSYCSHIAPRITHEHRVN